MLFIWSKYKSEKIASSQTETKTSNKLPHQPHNVATFVLSPEWSFIGDEDVVQINKFDIGWVYAVRQWTHVPRVYYAFNEINTNSFTYTVECYGQSKYVIRFSIFLVPINYSLFLFLVPTHFFSSQFSLNIISVFLCEMQQNIMHTINSLMEWDFQFKTVLMRQMID